MNILDSQPASIVVASGTTVTGLSTWLNLIPSEIGKLATVVGIVLSITLIVMHVRKMRQEARESALREEILREQLRREKASNSAEATLRSVG
jgi:hypothetical protein